MSETAAPAATDNDEWRAWMNRERHVLVRRLELSAIYHGRRERFLLSCERVAQAIAAITATAAFSKLISEQSPLFAWIMMLVAVASILPLVFGWSSRSNKHAVLAGDHRRLLAQVNALGHELTAEQLAGFQSQFTILEASEGASLGALVVDVQNEMAIACGDRARVVPLRWYHRAFMHALDFTVFPPSDHEKAAQRVMAAH